MIDFTVKNYYNSRNHCQLLPQSIRACIIGESGCGKTNLLMNLLFSNFDGEDYLDYNNLYIFSTLLHQPVYEFAITCLQNGLNKSEILDCIENQNFEIPQRHRKNKITVYASNSLEDIPNPSDINPDLKTIMIFDDLIDERQSQIEKYYTKGRHNNIDCFYLSQNYTYKITQK